MERELVAWLRERFPPAANVPPPFGIGDDAAVLTAPSGESRLVVTVDAITDQVDFRLDEVTPQAIGWKALGVNLSDLAAMAARPLAAVVALVLPSKPTSHGPPLQLAQGLFEGMAPLAEKFGVALVGGDTNLWDGPLAIAVTAWGACGPAGPLVRSGAAVGDRLLVTGRLGGSLLGRHLAVEPRVDEAILLRNRYPITAGLDVSDGLALDASRLAEASGCGVAIDLAAVPLATAAQELALRTGRTPLEHALGDGEDFELLFTAPPETAAAIVRDQPLNGVPVTVIGRCVAEPGLWELAGERPGTPLRPTGFVHGCNG